MSQQYTSNNGSSIAKFIPESGKVSLFIPYVPVELFTDDFPSAENVIAEILNNVGIFNIKRIDISKNKNGNIMGFVHFNYWESSSAIMCIREIMEVQGFYQININLLGNMRYIRLMYNKNPIPDIEPELNIEQLAAILESAEKRIIDLTDNDIKQKSRIEELENLVSEQKHRYNTEYDELQSKFETTTKEIAFVKNELANSTHGLQYLFREWKIERDDFKLKETSYEDKLKKMEKEVISTADRNIFLSDKHRTISFESDQKTWKIEALQEIIKNFATDIEKMENDITSMNNAKKLADLEFKKVLTHYSENICELEKMRQVNSTLSNSLKYEIKMKNDIVTLAQRQTQSVQRLPRSNEVVDTDMSQEYQNILLMSLQYAASTNSDTEQRQTFSPLISNEEDESDIDTVLKDMYVKDEEDHKRFQEALMEGFKAEEKVLMENYEEFDFLYDV
jgi:hypothetical protein